MSLLPALEPLLNSPVAPYIKALHLFDAGTMPFRPATDLLEPEVMDAVMRQFRPEDWEQEQRAVFSHWTQYYFLRLLPPVLAANLMFQQKLPLALSDMGVALDDSGLPIAFVLKNEGERLCEDVTAKERFILLREYHLEPLIAAWSCQARVSERVMWSNAGRYLDWILIQFQQLASSDQVWQSLQVWLESPYDHPGWHRRICCLRDRLSGVAMCPDCPKAANV